MITRDQLTPISENIVNNLARIAPPFELSYPDVTSCVPQVLLYKINDNVSDGNYTANYSN